MAEERVQRKLAAILAADVVGYSRLMGEDEAGTRARFNAYLHELIEPAIASRQGRIVKTTGDGLLVEFASVVDAVQCAVDIQKGMSERIADEPEDRRMEFRIGVNLGDVIIEGDDLHGDGVNVSARLEGLADPGGIFISGTAFDQIHKNVDVGYEFLGEQQVKNIADPVRVYRVLTGPDDAGRLIGANKKTPVSSKWSAIAAVVAVIFAAGGVAWWQPWVPDVEPASIDKMAFKLPDRPSIAVLPFTNMSGDKAQEYFADGITEDIITDLSKVSGLFVVSRNSTFTYKGKPVKVNKVAQDLGIRYVLEGSVRRATDRIRINVQLIDALKGNHVWAERYDRELRDVFAVQNDVTRRVVSELAVTLKTNEQERLYRRHTENLEAYETFLRARQLRTPTRENNIKAKALFERVIELDPKFAGGYAGLSFIYARGVRHGLVKSRKEAAKLSLDFAQRAVAADNTFGWSYIALGGAYLANRKHDKAVTAMEEALRIQPSDADAHVYRGFYLHWAGRGEDAIAAVKQAMRLDPTGRSRRRQVIFLGFSNFTAGRYKNTIALLEPHYPYFSRRGHVALGFLAAAHAGTGNLERARAVVKAYLKKKPRLTVSKYPLLRNYKRKKDKERFAELLRKADLPE